MKKQFHILGFLVLACFSLHAGPLEKGFEALKVFNYFDAKGFFDKAMKSRPAGASYGLSTIFYRTDNPFSNVDSAHKYILLAEKNFKSSDVKEKEDLKELLVTLAAITEQKEKITERGFEKAKTGNTVESLDWFIKKFNQAGQKKEAIKIRNRLAFENAKKVNTAQSYKDFISKYPDAEDTKDAKWLYDLIIYNTLTNSNTIETYESFIKQYPKSAYLMQAEDSIYIFSTRKETVNEYDAFIKKYPQNHNVKKAWENIYRISTLGASTSAYANFLFDFPAFPDKGRVKADSDLARINFFLIQQEGKWGYIDSTGNVRIPCAYNWADDFTEGYAGVMLNEKAGYIGKSGNILIPLAYDEANAFHEGYAIVKKGGKFGLIHKTGNQVLPFAFDDISYDETPGGEKTFRTMKDGQYQFYGSNGQMLSEGKLEKAGDFFSNRAYFVQAGKYGFINKSGEAIIPPIYDLAESFRNEVARVKQNEKSGLIDTTGKVILPCEYDNIDNFSEDLTLVVKEKKFGFANRKGEIAIPIKFDYSPEISQSNGFQNGLAKIELNKKRGLIDKTGKIIIPLEYDDLRTFSSETKDHPALLAAKKGKWGFVDKNKKQKINFQYEYAWDFSEGTARVKIKGKTGFINQKGELIIPATYDEATDLKTGIAIVTLAGKKGLTDVAGKLLIPCEMDEIIKTGNAIYKLEKNGKFSYYSSSLQKQIWTEAGF